MISGDDTGAVCLNQKAAPVAGLFTHAYVPRRDDEGREVWILRDVHPAWLPGFYHGTTAQGGKVMVPADRLRPLNPSDL